MLIDISGAVLAPSTDDRVLEALAEAIRSVTAGMDMSCHIQIREVRGNRQVTITEVPDSSILQS
jgi:hypothetical protein